MKRSPGSRLSSQRRTEAPPRSLADGETGPPRVKGMSRWRALDRKRFSDLIASPVRKDTAAAVRKDTPEGGPTSC
jgi:hypothetical protein